MPSWLILDVPNINALLIFYVFTCTAGLKSEASATVGRGGEMETVLHSP